MKNAVWRKSITWIKSIHGWQFPSALLTGKYSKLSKSGGKILLTTSYFLTKTIISSVFKIREHGLQQRLNSKIYRSRPLCKGNGQVFESVRIIDCYAAFLVMAYGFLISTSILIIERIFVNRNKWKIFAYKSPSLDTRNSGWTNTQMDILSGLMVARSLQIGKQFALI